MNKNINLTLFNLQDDFSWAETVNTVALAKGASLTSSAIDISQTEGEVGVQVLHASEGAATLLVEVLEQNTISWLLQSV